MATSTFSRNFVVTPEKEEEFVREMTKKVAPLLPKDFESHYVSLEDDAELSERIAKVLS